MREPFNSPLNFVESFAWAANDVGVPPPPPLLVSNCCAFDLPLTRLPLWLSPAFALLMLFMLLLLLLLVLVVLILLLKLNLECVVTIDFGDVSVLSELSLFHVCDEHGRQRDREKKKSTIIIDRSEYENCFHVEILTVWTDKSLFHYLCDNTFEWCRWQERRSIAHFGTEQWCLYSTPKWIKCVHIVTR